MCKKTKLKLSFRCPVVFPCWDYVTLTELAEYWPATNLIQNYSILLSRIQRKFYGMRDESKNWDGGWGWGWGGELEIQEEHVELLLYSGEIQIKFLNGTGLRSK